MTGYNKEKQTVGEGVGFDRIRRITGYLVGKLDRWNDAKRAEEKDRVKHLTGKKGGEQMVKRVTQTEIDCPYCLHVRHPEIDTDYDYFLSYREDKILGTPYGFAMYCPSGKAKIRVDVVDNGRAVAECKINYCPMCGRKLGGE